MKRRRRPEVGAGDVLGVAGWVVMKRRRRLEVGAAESGAGTVVGAVERRHQAAGAGTTCWLAMMRHRHMTLTLRMTMSHNFDYGNDQPSPPHTTAPGPHTISVATTAPPHTISVATTSLPLTTTTAPPHTTALPHSHTTTTSPPHTISVATTSLPLTTTITPPHTIYVATTAPPHTISVATTSLPLTSAPTEQLHTSLGQPIYTEAVITGTEQLHTSLEQPTTAPLPLTTAVSVATTSLPPTTTTATTSLPQPNFIDAIITRMEQLQVPTSRGSSSAATGSGSKRKAEEVLRWVSPQLTYFGGVLQFFMRELPTKKVPITRQMIFEEVDRFLKDNNIDLMVDAAVINEALNGAEKGGSGGNVVLFRDDNTGIYHLALEGSNENETWTSWEQYKLDLQKNEGAE